MPQYTHTHRVHTVKTHTLVLDMFNLKLSATPSFSPPEQEQCNIICMRPGSKSSETAVWGYQAAGNILGTLTGILLIIHMTEVQSCRESGPVKPHVSPGSETFIMNSSPRRCLSVRSLFGQREPSPENSRLLGPAAECDTDGRGHHMALGTRYNTNKHGTQGRARTDGGII